MWILIHFLNCIHYDVSILQTSVDWEDLKLLHFSLLLCTCQCKTALNSVSLLYVSLVIRVWTKSEEGGMLVPSLDRRWMWRYPMRKNKTCLFRINSSSTEDTFLMHLVEWRRTWLNTGERESELSHKVVLWCFIIVLHHKPNQRQLRGVNGELKHVVPYRVETCRDK